MLVAPAPSWIPFHDGTQPHRVPSYSPAGSFSGEGSPGDDYNTQTTRADILRLLEAHAWRIVYRRGEVDYLCRPGKRSRTCSATLGFVGDTILHTFSTNASPFESHKPYDAFGIYARLEHDGDFSAAGKALYAMGYGARTKTTTAANQREAGTQVNSWEGMTTLPLQPYRGYRGYYGLRRG